MNLLRLLKVLLRGLRPISGSLASISRSLDTLTRIQILRLHLEHNEILMDEKLAAHVGKDDFTELSFDVKEAKLNPETGNPVVEDTDADDDYTLDLGAIFGGR